MRKALLLFLVLPVFGFAQELKDTSANKIVISEEIMECVNDIAENPDAIKYLLQTLAGNKEMLKEIHKAIMNDPAMKEIMREMRNMMREDSGMIKEEKQEREFDIKREKTDYTELRRVEKSR